MQKTTIPFNTTSTVLLDVSTSSYWLLFGISLQGELKTTDKTTVTLFLKDNEETETKVFYGSFSFFDARKTMRIKIEPAFTGTRTGQLEISYNGDPIPSNYVGLEAIIPLTRFNEREDLVTYVIDVAAIDASPKQICAKSAGKKIKVYDGEFENSLDGDTYLAFYKITPAFDQIFMRSQKARLYPRVFLNPMISTDDSYGLWIFYPANSVIKGSIHMKQE